MALDTQIAKAFGLDGDAWQRHANPWSVYTRIPIPPLLVGAIWSRRWIGRWSLVPVAGLCLWTALNPRAFPPPASLDHWASKSVLGETRWGQRRTVPVPPRHRTAPNLLGVLSALGVPFVVRGLVVRDGWMTLFGLAVQMAGKTWFLDRMAILYDDVLPEAGQARPGGPAGISPSFASVGTSTGTVSG